MTAQRALAQAVEPAAQAAYAATSQQNDERNQP